MAEGGTQQRSFKDTVSKTSGDADESFCEPCKNRDKWIAVEGYCQICQEYLCDNCLLVHKNQRMTRGHAILDKTQMPGGLEASAHQHLCVEVCKAHHPEIVRFYCPTHDETGCVDCMTLNHISCIKERLQDISDGFQATNEFATVQQKLDKFHKDLEVMTDALKDNLKNLDTTYNTIQHAITSYRKHINDYLDQMQKEIETKAGEMRRKHETEMKKLIAENESMKTELKDTLQRMQRNSDDNVNSLFVITKQAKKRLEILKLEYSKMEESQHQQQLRCEFYPSAEIDNVVAAKTQLGKLVKIPNINTTASYRGKINVKTSTDRKDCWINDCTLLSPDRMVVTDGVNNTLKLIDLGNNTVMSSHRTSTEPRRVIAMSGVNIAATLPEHSKIEIYNITSAFSTSHEIKVNNDCCGIAYKDRKFAVSYAYPGRVEIIDTYGKVLHTIQPKQGRHCVLEGPDHITFGHEDDTIVVSDKPADKVIIITFKGQILHTYTHNSLVHPCGLVITADGVLFVCSRMNGCIHVVSPDFKTSKIIVNNDKHAVQPNSIAFCRMNNRLYISNLTTPGELNNIIHVYDLNV